MNIIIHTRQTTVWIEYVKSTKPISRLKINNVQLLFAFEYDAIMKQFNSYTKIGNQIIFVKK